MKDLLNKIEKRDYLEYLQKLPNQCIDLVCIDPPYSMTKNKWDKEIDLDILFKELNRVKKANAPILVFATGVFLSKVINANSKDYKYDLIWQKGNRVSGFLNSKKQPLRNHESILVFYSKQPVFNPQFTTGKPLHSKGQKYLTKDNINNNYNVYKQESDDRKGETLKYPKSILNFEKEHPSFHPTQKPVELLRYLIKTYSNENDIVLDCFMGSGTTAMACIKENREFIGCESNEDYLKLFINRFTKTIYSNL